MGASTAKADDRTGVRQGDRRASSHCAVLALMPLLAWDLPRMLLLLLFPMPSLGLLELLFRR